MTVVITYWQLQEDEKEFLAYLATTGHIVAVPDHGVQSESELAPLPVDEYIRESGRNRFLIGLEHHALTAELEQKKQDGARHFALAYGIPCLLTYDRGGMRDGNKLGQSHLVADWTYPAKDFQTRLTKSHDFIKWGKKVFAWLRRHTPEQIECNNYTYRATRRAKHAADTGTIEAVLY